VLEPHISKTRRDKLVVFGCIVEGRCRCRCRCRGVRLKEGGEEVRNGEKVKVDFGMPGRG
jgi:hypothetical protein